jgi:hypothetical protein
MVDRVVGEELSEPMLEARLDVTLEVTLHVKGFPAENTAFCCPGKEQDCSEHHCYAGDGEL